MNFPCNTPPIDCPGDSPLLPNANSELPDRRLYFAYRYFLDYSQVCQSLTPIIGGLCNNSDSGIYSSNEQTCVIDCFGTPVSYTAPSGSALGLTQDEADAAAYALACIGAEIVCGGGSGELVPNQEQSCSMPCGDGSFSNATIPAGSVMGFSQSSANAAAFAIACQAASAQCPNLPPPQFGNSAASSTAACPSGGSFTLIVPANTFFAPTLAEANAVAQSYADQQAVTQRACLTEIQSAICKNEEYNAVIMVDPNPASDIAWSIISGSLPPSYSFSDGFLTGNSTTAGVYTFTVKAFQYVTGNYSVRTYTIGIIDITTSSPLTSGAVGSAYSLALAQTGVPSTAVWSLGGGSSLPAGLSLSSAGLISGTPTTSGSSSFTVIVSDSSSGWTCTKDFTMDVVLNPLDWWKLNEAGNSNRVGSVNAIALACSASVTSIAGGKYGNSTSLPSQGTPVFSVNQIFNLAPVTGMAYAGNGIDCFVWIDIPNGSSSDTVLLLNFSNSAGTLLWAMRFTIDNLVGVEFDMTGGASGNIPLATSANYRFFELYYDPALTRLGFRVNNGAVMDQWITVAAPPTAAKGSLSLSYARRSAGTAADAACELAVYPAILNATQRAYIYNVSLGRTWPVVLP